MELQFLNTIILRGVVGIATISQYGGRRVANFSLVTETTMSMGQDKAVECSWFKVTCFEGSACSDVCQVKKGSRVEVVGRLRIRRYTAESGEERVAWDVYAQHMNILNEDVILTEGYADGSLDGLKQLRREVGLLFITEYSKAIAGLLSSVGAKKLCFHEYMESHALDDACFAFSSKINPMASFGPFVSVRNDGTVEAPELVFQSDEGEVLAKTTPIDYLDEGIERISELYSYIKKILEDPDWRREDWGDGVINICK